ncbi:hypothetical protein VPHD63_0032 [Vibrio phage D63]
MVSVERVKQLGSEYDRKQKPGDVDYEENHKKLCKMVELYGLVLVAAATGLKESTVRQHYRNKSSGTAMVSSKCIERAEAIFNKV